MQLPASTAAGSGYRDPARQHVGVGGRSCRRSARCARNSSSEMRGTRLCDGILRRFRAHGEFERDARRLRHAGRAGSDSLISCRGSREVAWVASDIVNEPARTCAESSSGAQTGGRCRCRRRNTRSNRRRMRIFSDHARCTAISVQPIISQALLRSAGTDASLTSDLRDLRRHAWAWLECLSKHHEDANGQFEMNWAMKRRCVQPTATLSFKSWSVQSQRARPARDFMPKPFATLTGSGCHVSYLAVSAKTKAKSVRGHQR